MFRLYTKRNKEEKAKGVAEATAFNTLWESMFDPDVSKALEATMLKEMTDTVEHRDYGRVLTRLSVDWSSAIRKTFTTADPKAFVKAAQKSEA
eukprot:1444057-Rhodomonas_salina.1